MSCQIAPVVVVSVVNWNTAEATLRCLHSLHDCTYPSFRIVVVDNASRDDSIDRIRRGFPSVTVLSNPDNVGFAAGHHRAWTQAVAWGAAAMWLLNSDAVAEPDALARLVAAWQMHGSAVYGGVPLVRSASGTVLLNFPSKYLLESGIPRAFQRDHAVEFDQTWEEREPFPVGAVPGSTLFLPLTLIASNGWMDDRWFLYCEEIDFCYRMRSLGVPRILVPQSKIWHQGGGSHRESMTLTDCIAYYRTRNEIALTRRHAPVVTTVFVVIKKLCRGAFQFLSRPQRAQMIFLGILDAILGRMGKKFAPERQFME